MAKFAPQSLSSREEQDNTAQTGAAGRERFAPSTTTQAYEQASSAGNASSRNSGGDRNDRNAENRTSGSRASGESRGGSRQGWSAGDLMNPFAFPLTSWTAAFPLSGVSMDRWISFPILMGRAMEDMFEHLRSFQLATQDLLMSSVGQSRVTVDEDAYEFRLEVPGYEMSDMKVHISPRALRITGSRQNKGEAGGRSGSDFSQSMNFERLFPLAQDILSDDAEASFEDGVLTIRIPRASKQQRASFKPLQVRAA